MTSIFSGRQALSFSILLVWFICTSSVYGQDSKLIKIKGSNIMAGMCDAWASEFKEKNPAIRIHVAGGGTASGLEALFEGTADVAMASRQLIEKELQMAAVSDAKPAEMEVARTAVAIVTHPTNPINDLTLTELSQILTGGFSDWKRVNGPEGPIFLIISPAESGTGMFLRKTLFPEDFFSSDANARNYFHDILKEIFLKKPPAIGYAGLFDAKKAADAGRVKILALKKDESSPAVLPSTQTVKDGSYPLIMKLYFYWDKNRATGHLKQFVDFCKTKGADASKNQSSAKSMMSLRNDLNRIIKLAESTEAM
jgi:phosphate transport system substrate-binding protein